MKYAKLDKFSSRYLCGDWNDAYLNGLAHAFGDTALHPEDILELFKTGFRRTAGNYVTINVEGDDIFIGSEFDESDDDRILIKKALFLALLNEWQELIKSNPDEIILHRDDAYHIWLEPVYFNK